jgi:hypothetical protein
MAFQRAWKSTAKEAVSNCHKIFWNSSHTSGMNDIPINKSLQHNAMTSAKSFLDAKEPDFILATDIEYKEKKFFEMTTNDSDYTTTDPDTDWTEVSTKKSKRKSPTNSPKLIATATDHNNLEAGFMLEEMDISDEALLGLDLARSTPLPTSPNDETRPDSPPNTQEHEFPANSKTSIINPYSRQSKLSTTNIHQSTLKSKKPTILGNKNPDTLTTSPQPVSNLSDKAQPFNQQI